MEYLISMVEMNALPHAFAVFEVFTGKSARQTEFREPIFTSTRYEHGIKVRVSLRTRNGIDVHPEIPFRFKSVPTPDGFYLHLDQITELHVVDDKISSQALRYQMKFEIKSGRVLIDMPNKTELDTILTGMSFNNRGWRKHGGEFPRFRFDGTPG